MTRRSGVAAVATAAGTLMAAMSEGRRDTDTKASNPKEAFGDAKMPDGLVPETAIIEENLAFLEGALKYGQYNWRVAGVKASTYRRAIGRHLKKWWNGQDRDPVTQVLELASVRACVAIMLDAIACWHAQRRPAPAGRHGKSAVADAAKVSAHLKELFKDHTPIQYTQKWVDAQGVKHEVVKGGALLPDVSGAPIVPAGTLDIGQVARDMLANCAPGEEVRLTKVKKRRR
jgi:hypothetical protein